VKHIPSGGKTVAAIGDERYSEPDTSVITSAAGLFGARYN